MSTAQLRSEVTTPPGAQSPSELSDIPEDRVEFASSVGLTEPDPWQERLLRSGSTRVLLNGSRQSGKSTMAGDNRPAPAP